MTSTADTIQPIAVALLGDKVLHACEVTAGRGRVIDWRTVRSGETLLEDGDAFDVARLFVALVGADAATAALEGRPSPRVPEVTAFRADERGDRMRSFTTRHGFKIGVERCSWLDKADGINDALAALYAARLAELAESIDLADLVW